MKIRTLIATMLLLTLAGGTTLAAPMGTAFHYQGRLTQGTNPVTGLYDLQFALYAALTGGSPQGGMVLQEAVPVTNGLFAVTLDFGAGVFTGEARWLELGVKPNGSADSMTLLSPRQPIHAVPYSLLSSATKSLENPAFLGTTTTTPLELYAGNALALRLEPSSHAHVNLIGGSPLNWVDPGEIGVTIAGGGSGWSPFPAGAECPNVAKSSFATIGGGYGNTNNSFVGTIAGGRLHFLAGNSSTIGGGLGNSILDLADWATIGGGRDNAISTNSPYSTISGGFQNTVGTNSSASSIGGGQYNDIGSSSWHSTIGGGRGNTIGDFADHGTIIGGVNNLIHDHAHWATIAGGRDNEAGGDFSFAAGRRAKALHPGSFVWADEGDADFVSTSDSQFLIRAGGGVGINKTSPSSALDVAGTVTATAFSGSGAGLTSLNASQLTSGTLPSARIGNDSINAAKLTSDSASLAKVSGTRMTVSGANIGIGKSNPSSLLDVAGTVTATAFSGSGSGLTNLNASSLTSGTIPNAQLDADLQDLADGTLSGGKVGSGINAANITSGTLPSARIVDSSINAAKLASDPASLAKVSSGRMVVSGGNIGIGTTTPTAALAVVGELKVTNPAMSERGITAVGERYGIYAESVSTSTFPQEERYGGYFKSAGATGTGIYASGEQYAAWFSGSVHVTGTTSFGAEVTVPVLRITGGADLAEPFDVSAKDIPKGSVVVIDEANPGRLKLSEQAYDKKVAGVVSGANGINPGIMLSQRGLADGEVNVALTGRVYVRANAVNGAIEPGDLLTSSGLPGQAMKVTDHAQAQGAVIGKAMTALPEGKGMVLVLVSLQ